MQSSFTMAFGENKYDPEKDRVDFFIVMILIVLSLPFWAPKCIPDYERGCQIRCVWFQNRKFIFYNKSPLDSKPCKCGDVIRDPLEIRSP